MAKSKGKPSAPKPKPKTEGQRQLLEQKGTEAELAAKLSCGPAIVGHWRRGSRLPGEAHRHKLELLFGIDRRSWDIEPGAPLPAKKTGSAKSPGLEGEDILTITRAQIDAVILQLENKKLTDATVAKLRDTLTKQLALCARLERDQEMLEDRAVREHPEWVKTKAAILKALKPFPEAATAVAEALK